MKYARSLPLYRSEINKYNPSCRYVIQELWKNYAEESHLVHNEAMEDLTLDLINPHSLTDHSNEAS